MAPLPKELPLRSGEPRLFRQVAVEAALGMQMGEVFALHWRGVKVLTVAAFMLSAALFSLLFIVHYSPIHRVPCYTDIQGGLARLSAPVDGQIAEIAVSEGMQVKKGDLLAVLSTDKFREAGDSEHSAVEARLQSERRLVEREIEAAQKEAAANHEMITRRISGLLMEAETAKADSESAERLLQSLREQADQFAGLVTEGYVSKLQLAQKRDEVALQESRAASARSSLRRIQRDIATSRAEQDVVDARFKGLVENRRREAGELERLAVQSDVDAEQVVRAPLNGVISTSLIVKGQSVGRGQVLFSIAALNEPPIVRLLIPARAAASVKEGMKIRFVLRAYPRERFGDFPAQILSTSVTPALPGDVSEVVPVAEASFLATATMPRQLRAPDGAQLWIKPGMVGEALIPLDRRTLIAWLLDPILRGLNGDRPQSKDPTPGVGT